MNKNERLGVFAALLALLFAPPAPADFQEAYRQYVAGQYPQARAEFLALAALGSASSQYNLGAMSLHGQGTPKSMGEGVGWLSAAVENGYTGIAPGKVDAMRAKLADADREIARGIVAKYGKQAMLERVLPAGDLQAHCAYGSAPEVVQFQRLNYPAVLGRQDGIVIIESTIGRDGLARDPQVLAAAPLEEFAPFAVESAMRSRYQPALRDGSPVESRLTTRFIFRFDEGGTLWNVKAIGQLKELADRGDVDALYVLGTAATLDRSLEIPAERAQSMLLTAAQGGNPHAQYWVAHKLAQRSDCGEGTKQLVWLRQAAAAGNGPAQVALASALLQPGGEADVSQARSLLERAADSRDYYARKHAIAMLCTTELATLRNTQKALEASRALMKDAMRVDPQVHEVAAAAYAAAGDFRGAVEQQQAASKKALALHWNTSLMDERLTAYRSGRPWSGDLFAVPPTTAALPRLRDGSPGCPKDDSRCMRDADRLKTETGTLIPK